MTQWLIPSNPNRYRLEDVLNELPHVDWRQQNNIRVGDIVYIYCSSPISQIKYKMRVTNINLTSEESTACRRYWINSLEFDTSLQNNKFFRMVLVDTNTSQYLKLEDLCLNGLKAAPQGGLKVKEPLLSYIESHFTPYDPTEIIDSQGIFEGALTNIVVNKYERNNLARRICLRKYGYSCSVCGINFEQKYGEIGKNFIHVHHIIPISAIGQEYQINPEKDLIPVCPNCHAMLHKVKNGQTLTIEQLRELLLLRKSDVS